MTSGLLASPGSKSAEIVGSEDRKPQLAAALWAMSQAAAAINPAAADSAVSQSHEEYTHSAEL